MGHTCGLAVDQDAHEVGRRPRKDRGYDLASRLKCRGWGILSPKVTLAGHGSTAQRVTQKATVLHTLGGAGITFSVNLKPQTLPRILV